MKTPTHSNAIVCIMLNLVGNVSMAQAQGTDADWKERAQRAADAPFRWILLHSTKKPAKPAGKPTETPPPDRPAAAGSSTPSASGRAPGASPPAPLSSPSPLGMTPAASLPGSGASPDTPASANAAATPTPGDTSTTQATPAANNSPSPAASAAPALKPLKRNPPDIPAHLLESVGEGLVTVRFTVLPNGTVAQTAVVKSSHPRLDRYVLSAVSGWLFNPIAAPTEAQAQFVFKPD
jgi:TonB family protein